MKITILAILSFIFIQTIGHSQCQFVYVSPSGNPLGLGTQASPLDIQTAILTAGNGAYIRLATGQYPIDNSLSLNGNNITIEGGFIDTLAWTKTSLAGASTIYRTNLNPQGPNTSLRISAFEISNKSYFRFQDLTIQVANAPASTLAAPFGTSLYGVYLDSCSDYKFVRCQLIIGNASNGFDGVSGANGVSGGNGIMGSSGSCNGGTCTFSSGQAGGAGGAGGQGGGGTPGGSGGAANTGQQNNGVAGSGGSGRNGGGGSGGGAGGDECSGNNAGLSATGGSSACLPGGTGGARGLDGDPGGDATDGANGAAGTNGVAGGFGPNGLVVNGFWTPGAQAPSGTFACGGSGGGSGGGGGRQTCTLCDNGPGNGGSGGGGGGQGGDGGTGGYGGGSSFGIYLNDNGLSGQFMDCFVLTGNGGNGGNGGSGGTGAAGGIGAARQTTCSAEIGEGGKGGNGGSGGNGGAGGIGAAGISTSIYLASGDSLAIDSIYFNLAAQPEIQVSYATCTNQSMTVTDMLAGPGPSAWTFTYPSSVGVSNINPTTMSSPLVGYTSIQLSTSNYLDFINLTCQSDEVSLDVSICQGDSYLFNGTTYTQAGTYTSNQTNLQGCDSIVTLNLSLEQINNTISANGLVINSSLPGLQYQWINCTTLGAIPAATSANYTVTQNGVYAVVTTNSNGCTDTSNCITINYVSIDEGSLSGIKTFPNPVQNMWSITFDEAFTGTINLFDANSRLIENFYIDGEETFTAKMDCAPGIYFVEVRSIDEKQIMRIIKN